MHEMHLDPGLAWSKHTGNGRCCHSVILCLPEMSVSFLKVGTMYASFHFPQEASTVLNKNGA